MKIRTILLLGSATSLAIGSSVHAQEVQEIVVTAQKRSERLQDVPISITAVTADVLRSSSVKTIQDINIAVPGIYVGRQTNTAAVFIRGIGTGSAAPGNEGAVATFVDGVYLPSLASTVFALNNIERIEVLKGPQGTLYGRNATGGAINVITRSPSHDPSAQAEIGYGNLDTVEGSLYATAGLARTVAMDVALYVSDMGKGFGRNISDGRYVNSRDDFAIRSKLLFEPTDRLAVTLSGDFTRVVSSEGNNFRRTPEAVSLITGAAGWPYGFWDVESNFHSLVRNEQYGVSGRVEYDLGGATLTSISAYRNLKTSFGFDVDATPVNFFNAVVEEKNRLATQELQIASTGDQSFDWVAGLYYLEGRVFANQTSSGLALPAFVATVQTPAVQRTRSIAAYAQASLEIADRTNLTLGARYTTDRRRLSAVGSLSLVGGGSIETLAPLSKSATFSKPTWRIGLDRKLNDDVMVYASYSRGFKSGVFNLLAVTDPVVKPEVVDAYEIGVKSDLFDKRVRLNLAGHFADYSDIQLTSVATGTGAGATVLKNAARSRIYGLDMDFEIAATDRLTFRGGGQILHARYTSYPDAPCLQVNPLGGYIQSGASCDASGNRMVRTPDWMFNAAADYRIPVRAGRIDVNLSYAYNDGWFWEADNRLRQRPFSLVNGQIKFSSAEDKYSVRGWVRNVFNEKYFYQQSAIDPFGDIGLVAPGRAYGAAFSVGF